MTGPGRSARAGRLLAVLATLVLVVTLGWMWWSSRVPDSYHVAEMGYPEYGGGPVPADAHHGTPVAELVGDTEGTPDVAETLSVAQDGDRITVDGRTPGPEVRAEVGDLVEVTLVNEDLADGTTFHWHGIDVPNAVDGVAGVTQDAVLPGEAFTYRFRAEEPGTYWYHAHQMSHEQVRRGAFGAVVIEPTGGVAADHEVTALLHRYGSTETLNGSEEPTTVAAEPGDEVRVRVVNTDNALMPLWVTGAPYRVLAVDGRDVVAPAEVADLSYSLPAGGRVDLGIVVPDAGARVDFAGKTALILGADPAAGGTPAQPRDFVDLLSYGDPADPGLDASHPDREFEYAIGRRLGFLDGRPGRWWTVNGHLYPDVPMFMVEEGDVVVFHIDNDSGEAHPMHLHGHHGLVLSRDGEPATGSPWWVDSLEVGTGESYDVAFLADNPGIWMDHCHNLPHAAEGLVAHLMYAGVQSSFLVGGDAHNHPE